MAKISTADLKNGMIILFNKERYEVLNFLHVKPGKGGAFVRTKLKNILNQKTIENTFRAGESLISLRVEYRTYQYLYYQSELYYFMDPSSFEQIGVSAQKIRSKEFLVEGDDCIVAMDTENEVILYAEPKEHVLVTIMETEPGFKGDRVQAGTKPAKINSGISIQVPLFINNNDKVKVNTKTSTYIERIDTAK